MQQFGCILCSALLLKLVASSGLKAHLESNPVEIGHSHLDDNETSRFPMLQWLQTSLDNWGSRHLEAKPEIESVEAFSHMQRKGHDGTSVETPAHELLLSSLLSLSLDTWGAKVTNCSTEPHLDRNSGDWAGPALNPLARVLPSEANLIDPRGYQDHSMSLLLEPLHNNPLAQVLPSESNLFDPGGHQTHSLNLFLEPRHQTEAMNLGIVVFILFVLASILCCLCWDGSPLDEEDERHSPTKEVQQDFATVEFSDGSWAQVYREARGEQKEALELLFRCNIISTDEFAFSSVSQEHIQECIWIATHMLRQKPLEEWVALWQQAQQTFEDSVTACFEARGGPHSGFSSNLHMHPPMAVSNLSLGAVPLSNRSNRSNTSSIVEEDEEENEDAPYSPHSAQDTMVQGTRLPGSQNSQNTVDSEQSRWSIEEELDKGLAVHSSK